MGEAHYTGRRQQEECSPYRRDAFCDEWNLHVLATTWEWEEDIDTERAKMPENVRKPDWQKAAPAIRTSGKAKLQRALVRLGGKNKEKM
ncbi:MAG: hypothetical protein ACLT1I_12385 [Mediterraneibacter faecis]